MLPQIKELFRGCMVGQNLGNSQPPNAPASLSPGKDWSGKFRVYWNGEPGTLWSVDNGTTAVEIHADEVRFVNPGIIRTGHRPAANNTSEPRAWIEGIGIVRFANGVCTIWNA